MTNVIKEEVELSESHAELDKHIANFAKGIKSDGAQHSTYKNDGGKIPNMKHVSTDASHQAIFKHLQSMGYKKTSGYDPKPNEFYVHHNRDEMTSRTDPVHHASGISAHVETEHGSRPKVHFTHRGMKEEVEQVAEVLTKSMGAGKWIKDFIKSKNPRFAGKSKEKRKEMALGAFYSKEEVERINEKLETETIKHPKGERPKGIGWVLKSAGEQTGKDHSVWERKFKRVGGVKEEVEAVDEGMFSPPKMITGKAAKTRAEFLRGWHDRHTAAKRSAGIGEPRDENIKFTAASNTGIKSNPYRSKAKFKPATKISFKAGLDRAAERAKAKANEEVEQYIPEGHTDGEGTPIDVGHNVMFKRGVEQYGKIRHINSGGHATISVYNGDTGKNEDHYVHVKKLYKEETVNKSNEEVSLDEGRGRPPKPGSAAYKRRQSEGGGDSDTPGLHGQLIKHKSLQNAPPKIKFTNGEEAHISAEHRDRAIKHLEGMIGPGKNPQARDNAVREMSKSHAGLMQAIGVESKPEEKKSPMSAQRDKPKLSLTKEESNMSQEDIVEKLQAALDAGILSQNDFDKLTQTEEVEAVDEKALSPKQKKIAAVAGDPNKIDAEDFKKLRKEETTAGVAAVAAALSRNLKELK
jgi:hypothetical protein